MQTSPFDICMKIEEAIDKRRECAVKITNSKAVSALRLLPQSCSDRSTNQPTGLADYVNYCFGVQKLGVGRNRARLRHGADEGKAEAYRLQCKAPQASVFGCSRGPKINLLGSNRRAAPYQTFSIGPKGLRHPLIGSEPDYPWTNPTCASSGQLCSPA